MIDDFNDNRALSEEVFNKFCNEYLAPFIKLVKKYNKELMDIERLGVFSVLFCVGLLLYLILMCGCV